MGILFLCVKNHIERSRLKGKIMKPLSLTSEKIRKVQPH
jgi:hypothetical protein